MSRTTKALAVALLTVTIACLFLIYLCIDRSISLAYSKQSAESAISALRGLEHVLEREWKNLPESEVRKRLEAAYPQGADSKAVVKEEGTVIWLDEVPFNLENGRLKSIGSE